MCYWYLSLDEKHCGKYVPVCPADDVLHVTSCRELAYQIAEQFRVLGKPLGLKDCIIVGGMGNHLLWVCWRCEAPLLQELLPVTVKLYLSLCVAAVVLLSDMVSQALELSNQPHVVVATPGRLADHIRSSSTFSMSKIQFLVSSGRTTNFCYFRTKVDQEINALIHS